MNLGIEHRVATIHVEPAEAELHVGGTGNFFWISMEGLNLRGPRRDDPKKIAQLVEELLLKQAIQS